MWCVLEKNVFSPVAECSFSGFTGLSSMANSTPYRIFEWSSQICWTCSHIKRFACFSQPSQIGFGLDARGGCPKYLKLRKDRNFFLSCISVRWGARGRCRFPMCRSPGSSSLTILIYVTSSPSSSYVPNVCFHRRHYIHIPGGRKSKGKHTPL